MKATLLLLACVLSVMAAGAYALQQKGLLSAQVLRSSIFERDQKKEASQAAMPIEMAASLREKEKQLEQRRQEAARIDERIRQQKEELELEAAKLDEGIRQRKEELDLEKAKLAAQLKDIQQKSVQQVEMNGEKQRMVDLIKIYEGMEAEGVASILESLPDKTVSEVLLQMRRRQASQVMGSLSIQKGVAVSARILPDVSEIINQQMKKVER